MRNIVLSITFLLFGLTIQAQSLSAINEKVFNFGATVGFSSSLPVINSITVNEYKMENIRVEYKVGYLASAFCRINFDRFFIQPSFSWVYSENEIHFSAPQLNEPGNPEETTEFPMRQLDVKVRSLEAPVLIGYNVVKQDAYALSVMAGPKFKYNYKVSYSSVYKDSPFEFESDSTPYGISFAMGVGVSIWRLFFDFVYEFGLNQVESDFKNPNEHLPLPDTKLQIDKRTNVMSFSLGFLF